MDVDFWSEKWIHAEVHYMQIHQNPLEGDSRKPYPLIALLLFSHEILSE